MAGRNRSETAHKKPIQREDERAAEEHQQQRDRSGLIVKPKNQGRAAQGSRRAAHKQEEQLETLLPRSRRQPDHQSNREEADGAPAQRQEKGYGADAAEQGGAEFFGHGIRPGEQIQGDEQSHGKEAGGDVGVGVDAEDAAAGNCFFSHSIQRVAKAAGEGVVKRKNSSAAGAVHADNAHKAANGGKAPQQAGNVPPVKAGQQDHRQRKDRDELIKLGHRVRIEGRIDGRRTVHHGEGQQTKDGDAEPDAEIIQRCFPNAEHQRQSAQNQRHGTGLHRHGEKEQEGVEQHHDGVLPGQRLPGGASLLRGRRSGGGLYLLSRGLVGLLGQIPLNHSFF